MNNVLHFIFIRLLYRDVWCITFPNWIAGVVGFYAGYVLKGKQLLREHREHQKKIAEIHEHLGLTKKKGKK